MPSVIKTEVAVILFLAAAALGWALGQYLSKRIGIGS